MDRRLERDCWVELGHGLAGLASSANGTSGAVSVVMRTSEGRLEPIARSYQKATRGGPVTGHEQKVESHGSFETSAGVVAKKLAPARVTIDWNPTTSMKDRGNAMGS
jgi:hypothetical protein